MTLITPYGGTLIERTVRGDRREAVADEAGRLPKITLSEREQCDLELLAVGAYSPLDGFMGEADFHAVCDGLSLASRKLPWPIPITCAPAGDAADRLDVGRRVCLVDGAGRPLAVLTVREKYRYDKQKEAEKVFLTNDDAHPGVQVTRRAGGTCLAGPVEVLTPCHEPEFMDFRLPPAATRETFDGRGWSTIVAFQTRNPIHRAHEYLTKCAMEICDGLLIHPLVGQTQPGDIPADVRMRCYRAIIASYYPSSRTVLSVMPGAMRYAGPREAVLHAIIRRNYGCSHFIVGRDHAGVGEYYGTYDAQKIFDTIDPGEATGLGIVPLRFEHAVWCRRCEGMSSVKSCPHGAEDHVFLSGKKVRSMLAEGQRPPIEFSRPEVADVLIESMRGG